MGFVSNFWDFIWMFLTIFVFIVYLMALFSIIGDLFRDHKQSGWAKALWIIFLIAIPFLGALVYLIARGGGMAQRQQEAVAAMQKQSDDYIRTVAGTSAADEISKAKALLDSGAINQAEFDAIKAKVTK